jgi:molybdenum cofactor synthesis domain-containing protein
MNRPDIKRLPKRSDPIEAQKKLLDAISSIVMPTETVALGEAFGRVLAVDAISGVNIPAYDKTFIDGYAINPKETAEATAQKPAVFKISGKLFPADYPTTLEVSKGTAVYVACGAPIPKGASATVKVEETRLKNGNVEIVREIKAGEGIIPLGDDLKEGATVLKKGQVLRPQDVGLLASLGLSSVEVVKKPKVAILSGGDELIKQCNKMPLKIANNYALVVSGLAMELGASTELMGIMPDDLSKVQDKIAQALTKSDIVITIGGSSVGVKDFVPDAVNALGAPGVVAQGVLLRPGAISGFGIVDGKPVIMLPGHIGSCIAGFYLFAAPAISRLCGAKNAAVSKLNAELAEEVESGTQFLFMFVSLKRVGCRLVAQKVVGGSSALSTIAKSNGYVIVALHTKLEKGSAIEVSLFGKQELSQF